VWAWYVIVYTMLHPESANRGASLKEKEAKKLVQVKAAYANLLWLVMTGFVALLLQAITYSILDSVNTSITVGAYTAVRIIAELTASLRGLCVILVVRVHLT